MDYRPFDEPIRQCEFIREIELNTPRPNRVGMLVRLTPGVIGQDFDRGDDISEFVLFGRWDDQILFPTIQLPCFVYITIPVKEISTDQHMIELSETMNVATGELYATEDDAKKIIGHGAAIQNGGSLGGVDSSFE